MFIFTVYDKDSARYIAVQVTNPPAFEMLDLPRCLDLVKQKANAPVVAIEIYYLDSGGFRIKYLAERR